MSNNIQNYHQHIYDVLMLELQKGDDSVKSEDDWVSEEELAAELGVEL